MDKPCNPIEQQSRQDQLEALYAADGRHDPAHPAHATYTGLCDACACPCSNDQEVEQ
jgi:hypothetical protein